MKSKELKQLVTEVECIVDKCSTGIHEGTDEDVIIRFCGDRLEVLGQKLIETLVDGNDKPFREAGVEWFYNKIMIIAEKKFKYYDKRNPPGTTIQTPVR